ncbi:PREDICTED: protein DYAD-like isoform X1 [Lupinus angustifolius]|uniref:protein DYAD-like isoform X1 n=1 Tax=Lupinus angustifolius TaxID=3871 RepID=UPI00092EA69A|nr:PREDICTED: protein DYAD-like isoform X1 [Lupinus angustifolius]XP_019432392.1 PREDICTED: protein DYAD-like isoform X1 [Lupinus angustifolius]XP_019432393.1 PREDICTED: protein DYAD-like isoform X1 [Lupinus angustifolius]
MDRWGVCHQAMFISKHDEYGCKLSSSASEEEEPQDEEKHIKPKPIFMPKFKKRKRLSRNRLREIKAGLHERQSGSKVKSNREESGDKWPDERYKLAEKSMWGVLKNEGATSENPITQPSLRMAARKHIGDTGLLDHLLKHIDGKVAPGGTELFRRRFNTSGIMEYWLESANLGKVHQEAGVNDSYWIPPSTFRADNVPSQNADTIGELEILKIEMAQMKKDMEELIAKQQEKSEISLMEFYWQRRNEALMKWKAMTEQRLTEITTSLNGVQGMHDNMFIWKTKVEQQLVVVTNKLSDLQASKEHTTFSSPAVRWQDWLENSNPDSVQGNEFAPWFGNPELLNVPQEILLQDPYSTLPIVPVNEELTNMKSDLLELGPKKQEDQPNVTPDSCSTVNSKSDLDNSLILFQEMFMELFTWKDKMEQQLLEVSNTVFGMLNMK